MNKESNQGRSFNMEEFAKKSDEFYNQVKAGLEAKYKGKYVAIDFESKQYWFGETVTEALSKAKKEFPDKLFYLLQIGSPAPFNIQSVKIRPYLNPSYAFTR
jgi:hypothetical protein